MLSVYFLFYYYLKIAVLFLVPKENCCKVMSLNLILVHLIVTKANKDNVGLVYPHLP